MWRAEKAIDLWDWSALFVGLVVALLGFPAAAHGAPSRFGSVLTQSSTEILQLLLESGLQFLTEHSSWCRVHSASYRLWDDLHGVEVQVFPVLSPLDGFQQVDEASKIAVDALLTAAAELANSRGRNKNAGLLTPAIYDLSCEGVCLVHGMMNGLVFKIDRCPRNKSLVIDLFVRCVDDGFGAQSLTIKEQDGEFFRCKLALESIECVKLVG